MHMVTVVLHIGLALLPPEELLLNEIYLSHDGQDVLEFVELLGTPAASLDGVLVLVVEGDGTTAGRLDRAWELTGGVVPADGYFVLGDAAVAERDYEIGASNRIENGTATFYVVRAVDPQSVLALLGTDLDPDGDGTTGLATAVAMLDLVGVVDGGYDGTPSGDRVYDLAPVLGPDGASVPAGVFRTGVGGSWCATAWLDFDSAANADERRSPGAVNLAACTGSEPGSLVCAGGAGCPCGSSGGPDEGCAHSGGRGMGLAASGTASLARDDLHLVVGGSPPGNTGLFFCGSQEVPPYPVYGGLSCIGGDVRSFRGLHQEHGAVSDGRFVAQLAPEAWFVPGATYTFQYWSRDVARGPGPCGSPAALSPAYRVQITP